MNMHKQGAHKPQLRMLKILPSAMSSNARTNDQNNMNQTLKISENNSLLSQGGPPPPQKAGRRATSIFAERKGVLPQEPLNDLLAQGFQLNPRIVRNIRKEYINTKALGARRTSQLSDEKATVEMISDERRARAKSQGKQRGGGGVESEIKNSESNGMNKDLEQVGNKNDSMLASEEMDITPPQEVLTILQGNSTTVKRIASTGSKELLNGGANTTPSKYQQNQHQQNGKIDWPLPQARNGQMQPTLQGQPLALALNDNSDINQAQPAQSTGKQKTRSPLNLGALGGQADDGDSLETYEAATNKRTSEMNLSDRGQGAGPGGDLPALEALSETKKVHGDPKKIPADFLARQVKNDLRNHSPIFVKQNEHIVKIMKPPNPIRFPLQQVKVQHRQLPSDQEVILQKLQNHIMFVQQREYLLNEEIESHQQKMLASGDSASGSEEIRQILEIPEMLGHQSSMSGSGVDWPEAHSKTMSVQDREREANERLKNIMPTTWQNLIRQKDEMKRRINEQYIMPKTQKQWHFNKQRQERILKSLRSQTPYKTSYKGVLDQPQCPPITAGKKLLEMRRHSELNNALLARNINNNKFNDQTNEAELGVEGTDGRLFTNENLLKVSQKTIEKSIETDRGMGGDDMNQHQSSHISSTGPTSQKLTATDLIGIRDIQAMQQRNKLREYSPFLTENASSLGNKYKPNIVRNAQYYRDKIDLTKWFTVEEAPPKKSRGEKRREVASRGRTTMLIATNDAEDGHDEAGVRPPTDEQPVSLAPESDQRQRQAKNQRKYNLNLEVSKVAVQSALNPSRLAAPSDRLNAAANYSQHATTRGQTDNNSRSHSRGKQENRNSSGYRQSVESTDPFAQTQFTFRSQFAKFGQTQDEPHVRSRTPIETPEDTIRRKFSINGRKEPASTAMGTQRSSQHLQISTPSQCPTPFMLEQMIPSPHEYSQTLEIQKQLKWKITEANNLTRAKERVAHQMDQRLLEAKNKKVVEKPKQPVTTLLSCFAENLKNQVKVKELDILKENQMKKVGGILAGLAKPESMKESLEKTLMKELRNPRPANMSRAQHDQNLRLIQTLDKSIKKRKQEMALLDSGPAYLRQPKLYSTIKMRKSDDILIEALHQVLENFAQLYTEQPDFKEGSFLEGVVRSKIEHIKKRYESMEDSEAVQMIEELAQVGAEQLEGLDIDVIRVLGVLMKEFKSVQQAKHTNNENPYAQTNSPVNSSNFARLKTLDVPTTFAFPDGAPSGQRAGTALNPVVQEEGLEGARRASCRDGWRMGLVFVARMFALKNLLGEAMRHKPKYTQEQLRNKPGLSKSAGVMVRACLGEMAEGNMRGLYDNGALKAYHGKTAIPREQFFRDFNLNSDKQQDYGQQSINGLLQAQRTKMTYFDSLKQKNENQMLPHGGNMRERAKAQSNEALHMPMINIFDGCLSICELSFNQAQAQRLDEYIKSDLVAKLASQQRIRSIIIDACVGMSDEVLAGILTTIQSKFGESITKLTIANQTIGLKSAQALQPFLDKLYSLTLKNLQFISQDFEPARNALALAHCLGSFESPEGEPPKPTLLHLNVSTIDMNPILPCLLKAIESQIQSLLSLDISWCSLRSPHLTQLCQHLMDAAKTSGGCIPLRNLNISYNSAGDWDRKGEDSAHDFSAALVELTQSKDATSNLTHLNLSGLKLSDQQVINVCEILSREYRTRPGSRRRVRSPEDSQRSTPSGGGPPCPILVALHLSDMGICHNSELQEDILQMFGVVDEEFSSIFGVFKALRKSLIKKEPHHSSGIDYTGNIEKCLAGGCIKDNEKVTQLQKERLKIQSNFVKYLQSKNLQTKKMHIQQETKRGLGRNNEGASNLDDFILTRKLNFPELIFNQDSEQDYNNQKRFFERDHSQHWARSQKIGSCMACQKHRYTMIFYDRNIVSKNAGLVEMKDAKLKYQLQREYKELLKGSGTRQEGERGASKDAAGPQCSISSPMICGTVVNYKSEGVGGGGAARISNASFKRKLRMIRADLFALLCVSETSDFLRTGRDAQVVKDAVLKYLQTEDSDRVDKMDIFPYLKGWNVLLNRKCNNNQVVDTLALNCPDSLQDETRMEGADNNTFVYAAFLEPGYHQLLIYDPADHRAYCQEVFVEPSEYEIFPELPKQLGGMVRPQKLAPVFSKWVHDTTARWREAHANDTRPREPEQANSLRLPKPFDNFEPEKFIRSKEDIEECEKILTMSSSVIQVNFVESIARSEKYPEIDFKAFSRQVQRIQKKAIKNGTELEYELTEEQIEQSFLGGATKKEQKRTLKGGLCRGEYLESLLRLAFYWAQQVHKKNAHQQEKPPFMISNYLDAFIDTYLVPIFQSSQIPRLRSEIHKSKNLNKLLFLNSVNIKRLFNEHLVSGRTFTPDSAMGLLELDNQVHASEEHYWKPLEPTALHRQFAYSKPTVLDERGQGGQYQDLAYVQFLEFICRLGILHHRKLFAQTDEKLANRWAKEDDAENEGAAAQKEAEDEDEASSEEFDNSDISPDTGPQTAIEDMVYGFLLKLFARKYAQTEEIRARAGIIGAGGPEEDERARALLPKGASLWTKETNPLWHYVDEF